MTDLSTLRPLVEIIAAERTSSAARPELFEDAVQEGLIAAWQALEARPDAPTAYVTGAARNGVRAVLRGRPLTGATSHRGRSRVDALDYASELFAEADDDESGDYGPFVDVGAEAAFEAVDDRLTAAALWAHVAALPDADRAIVEGRFVEGLSWAEVAARSGRKSEAARRRFIDHVAPRLRAELAA